MGQENTRRALEIAAAGGHNLLLIGSPGAGKSMLAKRLPSILPDMSREEALEVSGIWSVAGLADPQHPPADPAPLPQPPPHRIRRRPHWRRAAAAAGEISLAHNGVLFLDELPEFHRDVLEAMRQPLEDGTVTVARSGGTLHLPARFQLVCAMNPCRCGWRGTPPGGVPARTGRWPSMWRRSPAPCWTGSTSTSAFPRWNTHPCGGKRRRRAPPM